MYAPKQITKSKLVWRMGGIVVLLIGLAVASLPGMVMARGVKTPAHSLSTSLIRPPTGTVGDPLPRIQCSGNYTASIYAEGLSSPDGLAINPDGVLYVAEESAGRVSRVEMTGSVLLPVLTGLQNPEGITFDDAGNLYAVEDVQNGRLIKMTPAGVTATLAGNLDAPEGVAWAPDGTLYLTESNVEFAANPPFDVKTWVTAVYTTGVATRILTSTLAWSYAGITIGVDGLLYITNEASGVAAGLDDSVFTVDPISGTRILFTSNLTAPEGLRFSANGRFPLYVAEEGVGGGDGRLSRVEANGSHSPFCTGFSSIEDVILDADGRFFVSEDGTGQIILIEPVASGATPPESVTITGPATGTVSTAYTFTATISPATAHPPITYTWSPLPNFGQGTALANYTWSIIGAKTINVVAENVGGSASSSHTITIVGLPSPPGSDFFIYLPLILK